MRLIFAQNDMLHMYFFSSDDSLTDRQRDKPFKQVSTSKVLDICKSQKLFSSKTMRKESENFTITIVYTNKNEDIISVPGGNNMKKLTLNVEKYQDK